MGKAIPLVGAVVFLAILIQSPAWEESRARRTARNVDIWLASGIDALDTRGEPAVAAEQFRKVLEISPFHVRAAELLAVALDRAARPDGSRPERETAPTAVAVAQRTQAIPTNVIVADPQVQEALMKAGLDLLYGQKDPATATGLFRQVLQVNPTHYGATYQLAHALDLIGNGAEARPLWEKVVVMAQGYNDAATLEMARRRLEKKP